MINKLVKIAGILDYRSKVGSVLILVFSLIYLRYIFAIPIDSSLGSAFVTPRTLPMGLAFASIIVVLIQLFTPVQQDGTERISQAVAGFRWRSMLWLVLLMLLYSLLFNFLGFLLATFLFLLAGFFVLGERNWKLSISISGGLTLFMWSMLTKIFRLFLDQGDLYRFLFT